MTEEIYQNIFLDSGNIRGSIKWSAITKLSFIRQMICCYTFIYKGKINHHILILSKTFILPVIIRVLLFRENTYG